MEVGNDEEDESVGREGGDTGGTGGVVEASLTRPEFDEDAERANIRMEFAVGVDETGVEDP